MSIAAVDVHRWTRWDYERLAAAGFFPPDFRGELVEGIVYDMTPQSSGHSTAVHLVAEALRAAFPGCYLRIQSPLSLGERSAPEPDVAVITGHARDYRDSHPATALLVVEVADHSLLHDRQHKLPVYALAGIAEVWILDLKQRALEVYREPDDVTYRSKSVLRAGSEISPLARPSASLTVADLLP